MLPKVLIGEDKVELVHHSEIYEDMTTTSIYSSRQRK
jgi:hypothetical protein